MPNFFSLLLIAIVALNQAARIQAGPPTTAARPVVDTYHDVQVSDSYRWLENDQSQEVRHWMDVQNSYARSILDRMPNAAAIRARVTEIMTEESPSYERVKFLGGQYFAIKKQPPKQQPMLVQLDSLTDLSTERVVLDPNLSDPTGDTAIDWYQPSPDGKLVAVSLSVGGTEAGDVHIFQTVDGRETGEVVPHTNSGTAGGDLAWAPDGKGFYYTRHPWPAERPDADRGFYQQVYYHALGTLAAQDRYELGKDAPRIAEIQLDMDDRTGRLLATIQNGDGGQFAHFLRAADGTWQQFSNFGDKLRQAMFGPADDLFLISLADAPRGKVLHITIDDLGKRPPETIIPQTDSAIVTNFMEPPSILATASRLYITYQLGGPTEVRAFDHRGEPVLGPEQRPLSDIFELEPLDGDDILLGSVSYVEPKTMFVFHAGTGSTEKTVLSSKSPVDLSDAEVSREFATSKDETRVPVNIIRRKGTPLDGHNPCLVTGYGGYGVSNAPRFAPLRRLLLDYGFVVAVANVRGGGEFGESWHLQGNLINKQNVFDDFAAVLRHLIDKKYSSSDKLGIIGSSNGGLLMGAILTQHPELVKAVVSYVGIYDALRTELSPNGEFNVTEFGTVKNPNQFRAMYAYSPYHRVQDGTCYPAVLMLAGLNDPRVEPMQSRKMIARLQAATSCYAPILLRTSAGTGHGSDTPLAEEIAQAIDVYIFLIDQLQK